VIKTQIWGRSTGCAFQIWQALGGGFPQRLPQLKLGLLLIVLLVLITPRWLAWRRRA